MAELQMSPEVTWGKGIETAAVVNHQSRCEIWTWGFLLHSLKHELLPLPAIYYIVCCDNYTENAYQAELQRPLSSGLVFVNHHCTWALHWGHNDLSVLPIFSPLAWGVSVPAHSDKQSNKQELCSSWLTLLLLSFLFKLDAFIFLLIASYLKNFLLW